MRFSMARSTASSPGYGDSNAGRSTCSNSRSWALFTRVWRSESVRRALGLTRATLDEARRSVLELRARPLGERGLADALGELAADARERANSPLAVTVRVSPAARVLPPAVELGLYHIAREALTNVARHAGASAAEVRVDPVVRRGDGRGDRVRLTVRDDMLNGFGVCHGGVAFSLADSALAFAANTHGKVTVAIENTISYPRKVSAGDVLVAVAEEESATNKLGFFRVTIRRGDEIVSLFRGTVYKTNRPYFPDPE